MRHVLIGILSLGFVVACGRGVVAAPVLPTSTPAVIERLVVVTATPGSATPVPATLAPVVVTATPGPPTPTLEPLPTPTPWIIVETVEVIIMPEPLPTPTPLVVTATPGLPTPAPEPLPTPTPVVIVETVEVIVTATPTATPTATATPPATPTVTPTPTATPIPPASQVFTGVGLGVSDPLALNTDRFAIFEIEASGPARSLAVSVLSQGGCVETIIEANVPFAGRAGYQVKPWETPACTPGVLAAYGSLLVVRTGAEVAWSVTIRQYSNDAVVVPPWAYEGVGSDVAVPVYLAVLDGIRLTAMDGGNIIVEMVAQYRVAEQSYIAMAEQVLTGSTRSIAHTRAGGIYLPIVHADPGQRWQLAFTPGN